MATDHRLDVHLNVDVSGLTKALTAFRSAAEELGKKYAALPMARRARRTEGLRVIALYRKRRTS